MKKLIAMLLVLGMSAGLLSGCGGGAGNAPAGTGGAENSQEGGQRDSREENQEGSGTADGDTYHLVWEIVNLGFDDPDLGMVQDAVNEITIPAIGVEVEFLTVPIAEMGTKQGLLVSAGQQIDLVCAGLLTTPANLVSEGLLQPITKYVNDSEVLSSLAEGILEGCTINGEVYAYPGGTANRGNSVFYYDKDLADQYNIQIPEKLESREDWEKLFQQIVDSGMEQYPISLGDGQCAEREWCMMDTLGDNSFVSYGAVMDVFNGTEVVNFYGTEEYREKCEMMRDWYEKGYCVPDSISNGYAVVDSMTQGAIFGYLSSRGVGTSEAYWGKMTGKNLGYIPVNDIMITSSSIVNFCWGVSSSCERPEKAVELLELLYSNEELANLMNYGIEDVHYVTREGSRIIDYPEGIDANSCGYGSFVGTYGDQSKIYQRAPLTDEFIEHIPDYMYPNAPSTKFVGYNFDPGEVSAEVTAVVATIGQYAPALQCGTVDPDHAIPEFLEALKKAGMDKIVAANQKQLDAWLSRQ